MVTNCEHPVVSSGFGDLNRPRISRIHVCFWDFGTSHIALFNGLMISDIRILVLHVYYLDTSLYLSICICICYIKFMWQRAKDKGPTSRTIM